MSGAEAEAERRRLRPSFSAAKMSLDMRVTAALGVGGCAPPAYLDSGELQYTLGRLLLRFEPDARTQHVLHVSAGAWAATAVGVSPSRRCVRAAHAPQGLRAGSRAPRTGASPCSRPAGGPRSQSTAMPPRPRAATLSPSLCTTPHTDRGAAR